MTGRLSRELTKKKKHTIDTACTKIDFLHQKSETNLYRQAIKQKAEKNSSLKIKRQFDSKFLKESTRLDPNSYKGKLREGYIPNGQRLRIRKKRDHPKK
jgi:hypothetical protein